MDIKEVSSLCEKNLTYPSMAKKLNTTPYKLKKFIKENCITYKYVRELDPERVACNIYYFDDIQSEHQAYIFGFFLADGWITSTKKSLGFSQRVKDVDVLTKIHKELVCKSPIVISTDGQAEINIGSRYMVRVLESLGVAVDKSYSAVIPDMPSRLHPHVLRGLFDGDGYLGRQPTLTSGSKTLVDQVQKIIEALTGIKVIVSKQHNTYRLVLPAKVRDTLLPIMYENASIYLDRKYNTYESMFKEKELAEARDKKP